MASRNEEDARLLYYAPRALLTQYQPTISIILLFRLPLSTEELRSYFVACAAMDLDKLRENFGGNYAHMTDKEVYTQTIHFFNR